MSINFLTKRMLQIHHFRLPPWITIGEALKDITEPDHNLETLPNHICSKYKVTNRNFTGHRWTNFRKTIPDNFSER